jgi:hypothetical protein
MDKLNCFAWQEPEPLPYLAEKNHVNYDIPLEVGFSHGISSFIFLY